MTDAEMLAWLEALSSDTVEMSANEKFIAESDPECVEQVMMDAVAISLITNRFRELVCGSPART